MTYETKRECAAKVLKTCNTTNLVMDMLVAALVPGQSQDKPREKGVQGL